MTGLTDGRLNGRGDKTPKARSGGGSASATPRPLRRAVLAVVLVAALCVALGAVAKDTPRRTVVAGQVVKLNGLGPEAWAKKYRQERAKANAANLKLRQLRQTQLGSRRALVHKPSSVEAIRLASIVYRVSYARMLHTAECESPGLDPGLRNPQPIYNGEHATGLFQFIPSTWASTPFSSLSIYSPYASALAAGWMMGPARRGSEWAAVCR